ncbi:murein hydrolase activator EnvC family protein [Acetobacter nitrogenifigens]|uniref:murein hydrolase activator EnvC family protein n=2 Tax=Acetobacter nitrogenifigens TaxID=285268 RepID=UPI000A01023C|nr:peptidoglycan DD-metalloendopeptidase family protein [Acetobacter nitrogenifigens]
MRRPVFIMSSASWFSAAPTQPPACRGAFSLPMIASRSSAVRLLAPAVAVSLAASPVASSAAAHHHAAQHRTSGASKTAPANPRASSAHSSRAALEAARAQEAALKKQRDEQATRLAAARQTSTAAAEQAARDKAKATALSAATVAAAARLQETDAKVQSVRDQIVALQQEQQHLRDALSEDARAVAPVLPLANRLRLYPADTLLANPLSPSDAVTGLLIIRGLSTSLESHAETLQKRNAELVELDKILSSRLAEANALEQSQSQQQSALAAQTRAARDAQIRSNATARQSSARVATEAARASSLQDAIAHIVAAEAAAMAQLQREAEAAERAHRLAAAAEARNRAKRLADGDGAGPTASSAGPVSGHARGGGGVVAGTLVTAWGQQTESGPASGMTFRTSPGASVRSPCAGTVEFASPFRSYGQMLILNCGRGYRFVLAGLGTLDAAPGQTLVKGAAIGSMSGSGSSLLVQLRKGQSAVDPAPFL